MGTAAFAGVSSRPWSAGGGESYDVDGEREPSVSSRSVITITTVGRGPRLPRRNRFQASPAIMAAVPYLAREVGSFASCTAGAFVGVESVVECDGPVGRPPVSAGSVLNRLW